MRQGQYKYQLLVWLWYVFGGTLQLGARAFQTTPSASIRSPSIPYFVRRPPSQLKASWSNHNVHSVALLSGGVGLLAQLGFTQLFQISQTKRQRTSHNRQGDHQSAAFTAHSLLAGLLMVTVSIIGGIGWFQTTTTQPTNLLFVTDSRARTLAAAVAGSLLLWDIPTSLALPPLRKADLMLHHVLMGVVGYVGALYLPTPYIYFYFGLSELSSVPLVVHDWYAARPDKKDAVESVLQATTAVFFTLIRVVWFTKITLFQFVPEVFRAMAAKRTAVLPFLLVSSLAFTGLQLYWFYRHILSVVLFGSSANEAEPNIG